MLPTPQLSNKALMELSHRIAVETDAGIDIRRTWQRETDSAPSRFQPRFVVRRVEIDRLRERTVRGAGVAGRQMCETELAVGNGRGGRLLDGV